MSEAGSGAPVRFAGYAAIFGKVDRGGDVISPGAFAASIARRRGEALPLLWQHRPEARIGTIERIEEDARGLRVIGRIDGARTIREILAKPLCALAFCWRLERRDGIAIGLTSHDREIVVDRFRYRPAPGMSPSAIEKDGSGEGEAMERTMCCAVPRPPVWNT